MAECKYEVVGLALVTLALLISLCINVILCIRRKAILRGDECCYPHIHDTESVSHYFHNFNDDEPQENHHNHDEQQENPIYGNINADRRGSVEVCYEMMTVQHARDRMKSVDPDLNYASLDLKVANKHKKKNRHQQSHAQGRNKLQDQVPVRLTPPVNAFLEVEADVDAQLPSRDTSTMVSHSSIYLNSQQIAQETVDMGRERELENAGWEDSASREWEGEEESMGRKDRHGRSNGSVRTQLLDVEAIHSVTDHFISSFNHNSVQQD
ncbi:hypothetical protein E3U43_022782 [Larimichthys crocea]|uniref:Uncharacterized protein n=1 Tax=Larimichthys crocea TaxID=215358 RepID=A0ACD3R3Z7_LARCR|nr:hypothetical protein E3U43_022782 [Larimichthys crocea]